MDIQAIEDEIGYLLQKMENQPQDLHELRLQIHEKLNEIRAFGMPLPADLVALERRLASDFAAKEDISAPGGD